MQPLSDNIPAPKAGIPTKVGQKRARDDPQQILARRAPAQGTFWLPEWHQQHLPPPQILGVDLHPSSLTEGLDGPLTEIQGDRHSLDIGWSLEKTSLTDLASLQFLFAFSC